MNSRLEGRLRKYKLPKSQALLPLFEAIVNSIDSLMDIPQLEKFIKIYTIREDILRDKSYEDSIGKIKNFYGNFGVMIKSYAYILTMGRDGLKKASQMATG